MVRRKRKTSSTQWVARRRPQEAALSVLAVVAADVVVDLVVLKELDAAVLEVASRARGNGLQDINRKRKLFK